MHETFAGPNATTLTAVPSPLGADATFGAVGVLDDELRDGPDARNSSLVRRYQGLFVSAGLVSPPGAQSAINLVFTAGERRGSTLAMLGPVLSFTSAIERAVVGGTGTFRMARRQPHAGVPRLRGRPVPGHVPCLIDGCACWFVCVQCYCVGVRCKYIFNWCSNVLETPTKCIQLLSIYAVHGSKASRTCSVYVCTIYML
ncbi:dirigent protein 2-like [Triticum dicoccoides]|uniref:dirigent protein 2-like n=1 Tax=Triticum dicoccoides TaxID=85692 RepID=UPI00188E0912|nr:dirigent protein 2-like [Triticum dicoccoides]